MKRVISLLVVLAMVLAMVPAVFAEEVISIDESIEAVLTETEDYGAYYWSIPKDGVITQVTATIGEDYVSEEYAIYVNDVSHTEISEDAPIEVYAGDEVLVEVYGIGEAATVVITALFEDMPGTEDNPITVDMLWNAGYTEATATVTVPVGTRYYEIFMGGTMLLTVNDTEVIELTYDGIGKGSVVFPLTNNGTEAAEYSLKLNYAPAAVGSVDNPDALVLGENTVELAAGSSGYYYSWTAESDGTLSITLPEDMGWYCFINNMTKFQYGENHKSNDDPLVNPVTATASAGDELQIFVNTFDPESEWTAPAGTLTVVAAFTDGSGEGGGEEGGEDGGETDNTPIFSGENVATDDYTRIELEYTPTADGTLVVDVTATPGFSVTVTPEEGEGFLPKTGTTAVLEFALKANVKCYITIDGYSNYAIAPGVITYNIYFNASEDSGSGDVDLAEYVVSDTALVLGDNTLSLDETAVTTIYAFTPEETGTYSFTVPEGAVIGCWGYGSWYLNNPGATSNTHEWTCTGVGQSIYVGVSGAESPFTLSVVNTGEYQEKVIIDAVYENKADLSAFTLPEDAVLGSYVDITTPHTAVLGTDGYYHRDSADGDVLLMDLNYNSIVLSNALKSDRPVMYAYVDNEDGSTTRYDIGDAVLEYEAVMDSNAYYPLTEDLIFFYSVYTKNAGTWSYYLGDAEYDEDTVWMYCCRTITGLESVEPDDPDTPVDGTGASREDAILIKNGDVLNVVLTAENAVSGVWYKYVADNNNPVILTIDEVNVENYSILFIDGYYNDATVAGASDDGQKITATPEAGDTVYFCVNVPEGDAATATLSVIAEAPGSSEATALSAYDGMTATVGAGQTVYYVYEQMWGQPTYDLSVSGAAGFAVTNEGNAIADENGEVATTVAAYGGMPTRFYFAITNNTEEEQSYNVGIAVPVGTQSNPDVLVIGENTAEIAAAGAYYYSYFAMEEGTLTITPAGDNWTLVINNTTSGTYGDIIYSSDGIPSVSVEVAEYDNLEVVVGTEDWQADTVVLEAAFEEPQPVAMIGDVAYYTVYEALNAAVSGDTVTLVADSHEEDSVLVLFDGITLDLGVYDLYAKSLLGLTGSHLTGTEYRAATDYGRLFVPSASRLVLSGHVVNNDGSVGLLPVWDGGQSCYVMGGAFYNAGNYTLTTDESTISFMFAPSLRGDLRKGLFTDEGEMSDNGLSIVLRLTWHSGDGLAQQDFVYSSEFVSKFCKSGSGLFTFMLTGYEAMYIELEDLTITPMIVCDNGLAFCGQTITGA